MTNFGICSCTACGVKNKCVSHPLLDVPICNNCWNFYHSGEFTVDDKGEMYCRWCGEGGKLCMCDSCPKAFCTSCIARNFGNAELERILHLDDRWSCYVCSPQPIEDLIVKNGWDKLLQQISKPKSLSSGPRIYSDISRGREKFEIPVYNEIDDTPPPLDFVYVNKHVSGGAMITTNPNFLTCCTCEDNCRDPTRCECALLMKGFAYDEDKSLITEKLGGIYECNERCHCHINRCANRVVGNGPSLPLEVFRCTNPRKGWGLRCAVDIPAHTFVADYIGEVILETDTEKRGLSRGDEYLFTLDYFGRDHANEKLKELDMKKSLAAVPLQYDVDVSCTSREQLLSILGEKTFELLETHGCIQRAYDQQVKSSSSPTMTSSTSSSSSSSSIPSSPVPSSTNGHIVAIPSPSTSLSWTQERKRFRSGLRKKAVNIIFDRLVMESERQHGSCTIDARWYGSVARFINHNCEPNLVKETVFADRHDVHIPRLAFFTKDMIPARTELCYDYGYFAGNVDGKQRKCLCGSKKCRKVLY